ncbi:MAG: AsmA-like C-terminal region-containing protein, partial [Burkholderiaceae bacterium]|nr:AsmA-like C-terminal region-containing protein [Burkholderiaceae bacterium]
VINPAIGLGTFLAQMFLRRPLIEAATQEFHIDGTWADPRITRLPRRTGAERKAEADRKSEAATGARP